ncbi:hypothetical protein WJ09_08595 [Burkholderia vietnamiensis]|nr:hypothetical protein WJ09_08595 [Burkholderia vietnamiensis]
MSDATADVPPCAAAGVGRARVEWPHAAAAGRRIGCDQTMKTIFCLVAAALLCAACAQGGSDAAGGRGGSIEMYGTIDQGVTLRH